MEAVCEKQKKKKKAKKNLEEEKSINVEPENETTDNEVVQIAKHISETVTIADAREGEIKITNVVEENTAQVVLIRPASVQVPELQTLTQIESKPIPKEQPPTITSIMKPYTESQLSALYTNAELSQLTEFIDHFVEAELKGEAVKQHPLYELLSNYVQTRAKLAGNTLQFQQLNGDYSKFQTELWSVVNTTTTKKGSCNDGIAVTASHTYNTAVFHRSVFQSIVRILASFQKVANEHVLYSYSAADLKLQIELYLQSVIANVLNVTQVNQTAPAILCLQSEPPHIKPFMAELRICISVLFVFQRRFVRDSEFQSESRAWLTRLVAVLLRLANFQDHLFLLNHILRCPAGISSWATSFIQVPLEINCQEAPFASFQINHLLAILANILTPIKARDKFLEDISLTAKEALWVMVDSEGEEDEDNNSLRENDLVALINQLPLERLFRALLLIQRKNSEDLYNEYPRTEYHILKYFAFSTTLLRIIYKGLQTYEQAKYKQFSKRLSRFIRHITQYATDQWEQFRKVAPLDDKAMLERLQVEYDALFLRSIYYLYSSQKLGAWQFLAVIPYHIVSIETLWKVFYFMHNSDSLAGNILDPLSGENYEKLLWEVELRLQIEDKITTLSDGEVYYLLNTFANMALARDVVDMGFIVAVTKDLLQIGFVSDATRDTCAKSSRILLTHITSKHPHLLSCILKKVKDNMNQIEETALYLYEDLPLKVWQLLDDDLQVVAQLLLNNALGSSESKLARMILSRLDYDTLQYEMQCDIALLVVNAVYQEPAYTQWGWQTIFRLKLHINDKAFSEIGRVQDAERFDIFVKGIREQNPLICFVAILMTSWGHLVPLICTKSLPLLQLLQIHQKHEAVLFALYLIVPLFFNCQECLINCEKFQEILSSLINADRGYISMAKSLIAVQTTVLQQFGNMIEAQIVNFATYNLDSPRGLVRLWINSLVSIPNWSKDVGVLYMLDVIIKACFFHVDALEVAHNILTELYQSTTPLQEPTGTITNMFKWVTNSTSSGSSGLISNSLSTFPWLAFIVINIEHEEKEVKSGLWREILFQLNRQTGKVSVDLAIKKAANVVKVSSFTSSSLCIYRWAQQALDTPSNHPLLPLLWQKFFQLFLKRIPILSSVEDGCVGDKFFDGLVNFAFLKRMKKSLQDTVEWFHKSANETDVEHTKQFHQLCLKLYKAYLLWLEETRLQASNLHLHSLPPQYEPGLLGMLINGQNTPWYEYMDYEKLKIDQQNSIRIWRIANFREKSNVNKALPNAGSGMESTDPVVRILRRLTSYDEPKESPRILLATPVVQPLMFGTKEEMFKVLQPLFLQLQHLSQNHCMKVSKLRALDCSYQELMPQLYKCVNRNLLKIVPCRGQKDIVNCTGGAHIIMDVIEARLNENIDTQIKLNRESYDGLICDTFKGPSTNLCTASVSIQQTIKLLQSQLACNPATAEMGVELFYHILSIFNEETQFNYLPTKVLFATCIEKLGLSHISCFENEMPRLLKHILKEPNMGGYLAPHFSASNISSLNLLFMYSTITHEIGQKYDVAFALLSKFEIDNWLQRKQPKCSQRTQLMETIIQALTSLGFDVPIEALSLHNLYRRHLIQVFEIQFEEHYLHILLYLLKCSNASDDRALLALSVWEDILNYLAKPNVIINIKAPLRDQLRHYAHYQQLLSHQQLLESVQLLSTHFTKERLQYGLYGLYPKCRGYIDTFAMILGMCGHGLVKSALMTNAADLPMDKVAEKIWPAVRDLYTPWLVPYSMQHLKENMAEWIQQLADDRQVLLPWISADADYARKMVQVFIENVLFMIKTMPGSRNILSLVWQWYGFCYTHTSVKDYILVPIHEEFMKLPWHHFWPTLVDLELMLRIIDQYLSDCHSFLGHLFMAINWVNWMKHCNEAPEATKKRIYQCLFNLLVKLLIEPNVKSRYADKAKSLLDEAENFDWAILDCNYYQHVVDWYVMSCDAGVLFKDLRDLDFRVLNLLKIASSYYRPIENTSENQLVKRVSFVKAYVKLVSVYANKNKLTVLSKEQEFQDLFAKQLSNLDEFVVGEEESEWLLKELLVALNISSVSNLICKAFKHWIGRKSGDDVLIKILLRKLAVTVHDLDLLGDLLELTINTYFQNNTIADEFEPSWTDVSSNLNLVLSKQREFEQCLINRSNILTLNAILLKRIALNNNAMIVVNLMLDWIASFNINEQSECKIPIIWSNILKVSYANCSSSDEALVGACLYKFAQILINIANVKGTSTTWGLGILNAIGINKSNKISLDFRFLCRALAGYILAQLPDMKGESQTVRHVAHAPCTVGQPGGNTECVKVLMTLDFGHSQGKVKSCAELALKQIQSPDNSMHNANAYLQLLLKNFFMQPYHESMH